MNTALCRLPDAELEVMQALWQIKSYPAHTTDISAYLHKEWKAPTLLKLLSRLEERGFIRVEKEGRANVYTPLVARENYLQAESRSFFTRLHGGSLSSLVASLFPESNLTQEDVAKLEEILNKGGK